MANRTTCSLIVEIANLIRPNRYMRLLSVSKPAIESMLAIFDENVILGGVNRVYEEEIMVIAAAIFRSRGLFKNRIIDFGKDIVLLLELGNPP